METKEEIKFVIGNSKIHGKGVIAKIAIKKGETIGIAVCLIKGRPVITDYLGKYVNHSYNPNSCLIQRLMNYNLVAISDINRGAEITADYNLTRAFLAKPKNNFV